MSTVATSTSSSSFIRISKELFVEPFTRLSSLAHDSGLTNEPIERSFVWCQHVRCERMQPRASIMLHAQQRTCLACLELQTQSFKLDSMLQWAALLNCCAKFNMSINKQKVANVKRHWKLRDKACEISNNNCIF